MGLPYLGSHRRFSSGIGAFDLNVKDLKDLKSILGRGHSMYKGCGVERTVAYFRNRKTVSVAGVQRKRKGELRKSSSSEVHRSCILQEPVSQV